MSLEGQQGCPSGDGNTVYLACIDVAIPVLMLSTVLQDCIARRNWAKDTQALSRVLQSMGIYNYLQLKVYLK